MNEQRDLKKRPTVWIAAALILIFLAGATAGVFFERLVISPRTWKDRRPPGHFPTMEMMTEELGLSAEQQVRIKEIFERNEERFRDLRGDIRKRLTEIREQLKREIDSVLTPEQIHKLQDMIERHKKRAESSYDRRRSGPPGRPPIDRNEEGEKGR